MLKERSHFANSRDRRRGSDGHAMRSLADLAFIDLESVMAYQWLACCRKGARNVDKQSTHLPRLEKSLAEAWRYATAS